MMEYQEICKLFKNEFEGVACKFATFNLSIAQAKSSNEDCIWHPGVYVWVNKKDGVLRVGRSLANSRKRALEHIRDNTGGEMKRYSSEVGTKLYLFNVRNQSDYHWVAALEIFFENTLKPKLKAGRQG